MTTQSSELTPTEAAWLKRFRRCVAEKPKTLSLHMENMGGELQVLHGDAHGDYTLINTPDVKNFFSEGDALN